MAFLRTSFSALKASRRENFESKYKFRKKVDFKIGSDVYVIPLGLERGFFETPTHRVLTHEIDGQTIGFGGSGYPATIKCKGYDENGNRVEALCCKLAKLERERFPESTDSAKRILNFSSNRIHIPVLILGNSLDKPKAAYPVSKVSILSDLNSEAGLNFSYLEMSSYTFQNEIFNKLGQELKNQNILEYDLSEDSEEFFEAVGQHLSNCIIKIKGIGKPGFNAALAQYSFFPFAVPAIANSIAAQSYQGDRETILGFKNNAQIMEKINEYLQLFNSEVDKLFRDWTDNELQEYYNSAVGVDLKTNIQPAPVTEEKVEIITPTPLPAAPAQQQWAQSVQQVAPAPQPATSPVQWNQPVQQTAPAPAQQWTQPVQQTAPAQQQWTQPVQQPVQQVAPTQQWTPQPQQAAGTVATLEPPTTASDADLDAFLTDPFGGQDPVSGVSEASAELDDFDMELGTDEDFLP